MRKTLEDLYYGNITPIEQQMAPDSELKKAVDRIARYESQLTEQLDEDGHPAYQTMFLKSYEKPKRQAQIFSAGFSLPIAESLSSNRRPKP